MGAEVWRLTRTALRMVVKEGSSTDKVIREKVDKLKSDWSFRDLESQQIIGRGGFGIVELVVHTTTGFRYAMKSLDTASMPEDDRAALRREKVILEQLEHPFVLNLVVSFWSPSAVYLLTELVDGGDLFDAMEELGTLNRQDTQFYVGSLLSAFDYISRKCIVHRDLKPENVLLTAQGYVKLADFGTAKVLDGPHGRTTSLVGTPHFMAPEVIRRKPYGPPSDMWQVGVCTYELMVGCFPFDGDEQVEIFRSLLGDEPFLPPDLDLDAVDFIGRLLHKDPAIRKASCGTFYELQQHAFFADFPWAALGNRELCAPTCRGTEADKVVERFAEWSPSPQRNDSDPVLWDEQF